MESRSKHTTLAAFKAIHMVFSTSCSNNLPISYRMKTGTDTKIYLTLCHNQNNSYSMNHNEQIPFTCEGFSRYFLERFQSALSLWVVDLQSQKLPESMKLTISQNCRWGEHQCMDMNPSLYLRRLIFSEVMYKTLLIGDSSVGKSSLILRLAENQFQEGFISTIGVCLLTLFRVMLTGRWILRLKNST
jgi:hypothetical protein